MVLNLVARSRYSTNLIDVEFREEAEEAAENIFSLTSSVEGKPTTHAQDQDFRGNRFSSHGSFQMNRGVAIAFAQSMGFENLDPESEEFIEEWDRATSDTDFEENERNFIKTTHFDPQLAKLRKSGFPEIILSNNKFQQLVMDVAVNSGPNTDLIISALRGKSFKTIQDIIKLITQERINRARGTPLEAGLNKRFQTVATSLS